jgi:sugar (pentulose or hexulose) kinase
MDQDLTLGIDSGTQSTKVVACDRDGRIVAAASSPHPPGCVQPAEAWWMALQSCSRALPEDARTAVCLPHDWLTWRLTGAFVTDRGDASGTGWWDHRVGIRRDLLRLSGWPELEVAALGIGAREGEVVVSLGASGTVFAISASPTRDASGLVAGFADATGRFLPLACTLNCTIPIDVVAGW